MKKFVACVAAVLLCGSAVIAAELKSGLEVGDSVNPFYVQDVTGPSAGKDPLCYRCQYGARPVVAVFTRKVDDKVAALVKEIDSKVAKNGEKKMAAFVVVLSDDPAANEAKLHIGDPNFKRSMTYEQCKVFDTAWAWAAIKMMDRLNMPKPDLEKEGRVRRKGTGYHPAS